MYPTKRGPKSDDSEVAHTNLGDFGYPTTALDPNRQGREDKIHRAANDKPYKTVEDQPVYKFDWAMARRAQSA